MRNTRTTGLLPPRNRTRCVIASPIRSQQTNFPNTCVSGTQVSFTCRCRYSFEICSEFSRVRAAVVRFADRTSWSIGPIDLRHEHVAALLLSGDASVRRSFEDNLARQLNHRGDVRIHLAVGSIQIRVSDKSWSTVSGASDVDHVEAILLDDPVQVNV